MLYMCELKFYDSSVPDLNLIKFKSHIVRASYFSSLLALKGSYAYSILPIFNSVRKFVYLIIQCFRVISANKAFYI